MSPLLQVTLMILVALGPVRLVPAFVALTAHASAVERRRLAVRGVAIATGIALLLAVMAAVLRRSWHVSWGVSSIATGLILLAGAAQVLFSTRAVPLSAAHRFGPSSATSPLVAPLILTPFGVAVVLLAFSSAPKADAWFQAAVAVVLLAVMALNLVSLLAARSIVKSVGFSTLRVAGWTGAILLAALAVQSIVTPLQGAMLTQAKVHDEDMAEGEGDVEYTDLRPMLPAPDPDVRPPPLRRQAVDEPLQAF
jgi:multiple antibiotic resistance protein